MTSTGISIADHAVGLSGAAVDLGDRLRQRLALLARQELGELVLLRAQSLRQLFDERRTLGKRARAPRRKRAPRCGDGAIELRLLRRRAASEHGAERGIDDVEMVSALLELAVDQQGKVGS